MAGYLDQLETIAASHVGAPIICAGDIFDDGWRPYRCPPELINFAIEHFPLMYAVPGQHDLPNHRYDDLQRSAYYTLCEAGTINNLEPGVSTEIYGPGQRRQAPPSMRNITATGFPWGFDITPAEERFSKHQVNLAVIHKYIWRPGHCYSGAPSEAAFGCFDTQLRGYNAAVIGDNHSPWLWNHRSPCYTLNCGTFIRRKADEIKYRPGVGLLNADGSIVRYPLDTSGDRWADPVTQAATEAIDLTDFVRELGAMADQGVSFEGAVFEYFKTHKVDDAVKQLVLKAVQGE